MKIGIRQRWGVWWAGCALIVVAMGIGAQEGVQTLIAGAFGSAGGRVSDGTVVVTGQLGSPFETVEISNGDVRVLPGLLVGKTISMKVGDFDGDDATGFSDFLIFAAAFGTRVGDEAYLAAADLDVDAEVGFSDFLIFAGVFGT